MEDDTPLVQRLRGYRAHDATADALLDEAAAEIERLNLFAVAARAHLDAKREQVEAELSTVRGVWRMCERSNDRLRDELSSALAARATAEGERDQAKVRVNELRDVLIEQMELWTYAAPTLNAADDRAARVRFMELHKPIATIMEALSGATRRDGGA